MNYFKQDKAVVIPAMDGKLIEELFGAASINAGDFSLAHMLSPSGWNENYQTPEFDEITYIIKGRMQVEADDEQPVVIETNQAICIKKGVRVRYSNPFDKEVEYISVCIPAFTIDRAKRDK